MGTKKEKLKTKIKTSNGYYKITTNTATVVVIKITKRKTTEILLH